MIRSMQGLHEQVSRCAPMTVCAAAADNDSTLAAVAEAERRGWVRAILVGDRAAIRRRLERAGTELADFDVVHRPDAQKAVMEAVRLVRDGTADMLLKGAVSTAVLLRTVLDARAGLRVGELISDVFLIEFDGGDGVRLAGITDGGVNPTPGPGQKRAILANAVRVFHALDQPEPRVAVLSATEKVTPGLEGSVHAAQLLELLDSNPVVDCVVDGPLALDLALSAEAARVKGFDSPVAGQADILLFPTLESANITAKAVQYWTARDPGHVIVGARAPVLIPSRSETAEARLNSIALGCLVAANL